MPDLRFIPLASSSHGNAYLLDDGKTCLLIECGVSYKKLQRLTGFGVSGIIGCLISHEHHDHAGCYEQLIKSGIPVYASRGTAEALECDLFEILEDRERVTITRSAFISTIVRTLLIDGDGNCVVYPRFSRSGDLIEDLEILPPSMISFVPDGRSYYIRYIMAKHAGKDEVPESPDEWLDGFNTFSIYQIFPVIRSLWEGNVESLAEAKKKLEQ